VTASARRLGGLPLGPSRPGTVDRVEHHQDEVDEAGDEEPQREQPLYPVSATTRTACVEGRALHAAFDLDALLVGGVGELDVVGVVLIGVGVILIDILPGVAIGVALSFILLIHTIGHPHIAVLGRSRDGGRFRDLEDDPEATPIPGVLIHRFEAELIFANADLFHDDLLARVHAAEPTPGAVVLDFEAVSQVDVTGEEALRSVHDTLDALGIRLFVARAKSRVRDALRRGGTLDVLGEDSLMPSVDTAIEAIEAPTPLLP
jgi:MFS superfamily sulfate permease-like transporter